MHDLSPEEWQKARTILATPFAPEVVKFRVADFNDEKPWATDVEVLAYADGTEYERILDEALTPGGWSIDYEVLQTGTHYVRVGKERKPIEVPLSGYAIITLAGGVTKRGYGEASAMEPGKGFHTDAKKAAARTCGVGRDFYRLGTLYANLDGEKHILPSEVERLRTVYAEAVGLSYTPRPVQDPPRPGRQSAQSAQSGQSGQSQSAQGGQSQSAQGGQSQSAQGGQQRPQGQGQRPQQAQRPQSQAQGVHIDGAVWADEVGLYSEDAFDVLMQRRSAFQAPMSVEQRTKIVNGCQRVGWTLPEGLDQFTASQAATCYHTLCQEYRRLHPQQPQTPETTKRPA